jgi:hypothetical protein
MVDTCFSKTLVGLRRTTRRCSPEDGNFIIRGVRSPNPTRHPTCFAVSHASRVSRVSRASACLHLGADSQCFSKRTSVCSSINPLKLEERGSSPSRGKIFFSPPHRLWGIPSLLSNGYRGLFPRHLMSRSRMVELYLQSSMCLHGVVLNYYALGQLYLFLQLSEYKDTVFCRHRAFRTVLRINSYRFPEHINWFVFILQTDASGL